MYVLYFIYYHGFVFFFVLHAERRLRRFGFKRTVTKWRSVLFTFMIDYVGFFRGPDFGGTQVCINCV